MAPSTANPSNLHRAPVACLRCRAAKVRCLVSQRLDRCDRCITNDTYCVFAQPQRARARVHPYSRRPPRPASPSRERGQEHIPTLSASASPSPSPLPSSSTPRHATLTLPPPTPVSNDAHSERHHSVHIQQPLITSHIRARIIASLATLKGKRGAPFSFITSGDTPSFSARVVPDESVQNPPQTQQHLSEPEQPTSTTPSLKLSWLLRPLRACPQTQAGDDDHQTPCWVKMPSYVASMTLGQTITDPIEGGIISRPASIALFRHFMMEMNAKWEYVLDPHLDTHDRVKQRSRLLFATILFCSSKFANYCNGDVVLGADPFLQSRLCSVARNLAIQTFANGDRSIETMQAFYLLVCWKDADDDVSYLHSGYAFRILHDLDMEQTDIDKRQVARRRRTWLALFRQDKQQSLFFMRRASLNQSDEEASFVGHLDTWLKLPHALPLDFVACCSADLRRIQARLRVMVQKASPAMLPCLLELMDSELSRWKFSWQNHLQGEGRIHSDDDPSLDRRLLGPSKRHVSTLRGLWEHSVKLNVSSAILRQALMASVTSSLQASGQPLPSSLGLDLVSIEKVLSPDIPGLSSSVEGAFGTLRNFLAFPTDDLRRSPDAILLLGPNTALFLCLLLCLPCNGILGPSFQKTAVNLIKDVARHLGRSVRSPQDTMALHSAYLDSLVKLLVPVPPEWPQNVNENMNMETSTFHLPQSHMDPDEQHLDDITLQAAHVLAGGMGGMASSEDESNGFFNLTSDPEQNLQMQSLSNLLDTSFFWEIPPVFVGPNTDME
ncbi:hypothetical protein EDB80DRAFT_703175 [Ilyonectria destructans]|nr:hypothetical protein EDB80DRAFT_703175 [Ilyonectria destructans]